MLPTFELLKPTSLKQALETLAAKPKAFPLAGGTNLIVDARVGKLKPETVIDISVLGELRGVEVADSEIVIGAAVTIAELLTNPAIQEHANVLFSACQTFANTLIRNRATIGGNLANNAPCADTIPALLVLNADVDLASAAGTRRIALNEFLVEPFTTQRQADEILTAIRFPIPSKTAIGRFKKMGLRKISCMAKVDVAMLLDFDNDGTCVDARIALGAASPVSLRVREAEDVLVGRGLVGKADSERLALLVADKAAAAAVPRAGSEYKQRVVAGLIRRLLLEIADEVGGNHA